MATKSATPSSVLAIGADTESNLANERWQQAYDQLLQAVEARQEKPMFDPFWLKVAEAGAAPTRTGNYFETLGNTAAAIGKFQEDERAKAEDLAKMRLELAGMGVERASQRAVMQGLAAKAGMERPQPATSQAPAPQSGEKSEPPSDMEPIGRFPVNPNLIKNESDFYKEALGRGQRDPNAISKDWIQYQKDFLSPKFEGGNVYDPTTGTIYAKRTGDTATASFMTGEGGSFTLPTTAVIEHQKLINEARKNPSNPEVWNKIESFENFYRQGPRRPTQPAPVAQGAATAVEAPVSVPAAAPASVSAPAAVTKPSAPPPPPPSSGGLRSVQEQEAEKAKRASDLAIAQARKIEEDKTRIAQEAKTTAENIEDERKTIVELKTRARSQANIADQMAKLVTEYPNAIGTASKPGFLSAGIKILESGANIGGETAKVSALEEAVATLKGTPEELSARRVMMGLAAEYLFNLRSLTKGQGSITDYETRVLSSIGPGLQDDPKTARFKAHVMKMHAEAEIERANMFQQWKEKNQGKGWRDFLASDANDRFSETYDNKLGRAYDTYLGRKQSAAQSAATPAQSAGNAALDFARSLKR